MALHLDQPMPRKLPFRVVHIDSEDENFPAIELNHHSPATRGWASSRFCSFPQRIVLALERRAKLRKIQLLCHQHFIASKVEFFVGDFLKDGINHHENARYIRLGYVSLSDNVSTSFKARELKSVHVDASGSYVQLLLHKNYANKFNLYNQVGIVAVNLIGDDIRQSSHSDPQRPSSNTNCSAANVYRSDFISPTEDLAFDIYQDPEVAKIIRCLDKQKLLAVAQERFDQAQKIRDAIDYLQQVGERLGRLSLEKQQAVEEENYERAKIKKIQIGELRAKLHRDLDLVNLISIASTELKNPNEMDEQQTGVDQILSQSALDSSTLNHQRTEFTGDISPASEIKLKQPKNSTTLAADDRPLPTLKRRLQRNNSASTTAAEMIVPTLPPEEGGLSEPFGLAMHVPLHLQVPTVDESKHLGRIDEVCVYDAVEAPYDTGTDESFSQDIPDSPEPLSESHRRLAGVAIDVVGVQLVTMAFSKFWVFRKKALLELEQRVTAPSLPSLASLPDSSEPDPRAELRSTAFLLHKALHDQVLSVFRLAVHSIKVTIVDFAERYCIPRVELQFALDKLIPVLCHRTGDTSGRVRDVAKRQILTMAQWPQVRQKSAFWSEIVRPLAPVTLDRLALSQLEIVTELYATLGVDPPCSDHTHSSATGFTLDAVTTFTARALMHRSIEVREAAENLMVALYRAENRATVRRALPMDDIFARRNPLYRRLFGKFERIDKRYPTAEIHDSGLAQQDAMKKQKGIEALQAEVQHLRCQLENGQARRSDPQHSKSDAGPIEPSANCSRQPRSSNVPSRPDLHVDPKGDSNNRESHSRDRFSPLPPQSTQLIGEAELLLSLERTCIFCGVKNDAFTEEGLDLHYWKDCPMLQRCANCKQVVEIAGMTDHLLNECDVSPPGHYVRCDRCSEAVVNSELYTHACIPCSLTTGLRCPLCHGDLPLPDSGAVTPVSSEDVWKAHLLGLDPNNIPVCSGNPRRPVRTQKALHLNSTEYNASSRPSKAANQKEDFFSSSVSKLPTKTKTGIPRPTAAANVRPV